MFRNQSENRVLLYNCQLVQPPKSITPVSAENIQEVIHLSTELHTLMVKKESAPYPT